VRFTATVNKANGQTNAATATVVDFTWADDGTLRAIRVRLHRSQRLCSVHRMQRVGKVVLRRYVSAAFWPLTLAHAATVHGVQGTSITEPVYIDIDCFVAGLANTALSRNTNAADITLANPLSVHDLRVINLHAFYQALEMEDHAVHN
jgi:hypothetical protein